MYTYITQACYLYVNFQGPSGLGFAIVEESRDGRQGIYVRSITVGGVADKDGQLSVGDQILEVQDKNLIDVHYEKVSPIHYEALTWVVFSYEIYFTSPCMILHM